MRQFGYLLFFFISTNNLHDIGQATPIDGDHVKIAEEKKYLFVVSIAYKDSETHFCGGSLITRKHVLTSAHCKEHGLTRITIRAGANDIKNTKKYSIQSWITYDEWARENNIVGDNADNDISIIELTKKVSSSIKLAHITKHSSDEFYGEHAKTVVWGHTFRQPVRNCLLVADLDVLSPDQFVQNFEKACPRRYNKRLGDNLFAAVSSSDNESPTLLEPGDSGSPLIIKDNEIIGIVTSSESLHNETCVFLKQHLFMSIDPYRDFIFSVTKCTSPCNIS